MLNQKTYRKSPQGIPPEAGPDFAAAVNEAAARGLTIWHLTEQWNGTWYCVLADPNSNSPKSGESVSYGRQAATPGAAIREAMSQFGATPGEKAAEDIREELMKPALLEIIPRIKPDLAQRFLAALAANLAAREAQS